MTCGTRGFIGVAVVVGLVLAGCTRSATGATDAGTLSDPDQCFLQTHTCSEQALCSDTATGFTCTCLAGYTGDGATCSDIDECATGTAACGANEECQNLAGSHACVCSSGYTEEAGGCHSMFVAVSPGSSSTCGVRTDGSLWCWGDNGSGKLGVPGVTGFQTEPLRVGTANDWKTVAVGTMHACGIRGAGTLHCWGDGVSGQLGLGALVTSATSPTQVGTDADWTFVSTGTAHTCAVKSGGSGWCWGLGEFGALGVDPSVLDSSTPAQVDGGTAWKEIRVQDDFSCGLKADGTMWCWGSEDARLGIVLPDGGYPTSIQYPEPVTTPVRFSTMSVGRSHSCAVREDRTLWCWRSNGAGQLGFGNTTMALVPTQVGTHADWVSVAVTESSTCGTRSDGTLWCWGDSASGQLGFEAALPVTVPARVGIETSWARVQASPTHLCAVKVNGTAHCWGRNFQGQLGIGGEPLLRISEEAEIHDWAVISKGDDFLCGIREDGTLWCWGSNRSGTLGLGLDSRLELYRPAQVGLASDWVTVQAGRTHACAIRSNQSLWCWGANAFGQLGLGGTGDVSVPARVGATSARWSSVAPTAEHTCGIQTDGTLWCWGRNNTYQLGQNSTSPAISASPIRVGAGTDWTQVSTAYSRSCGVRGTGQLWCWGLGGSILGVGGAIPTQHLAFTDWTSVQMSSNHACGLRGTGTLNCFGYNGDGELGLGDKTTRATPSASTNLLAGTDWTQVRIGAAVSCALKSAGTLHCWGRNDFGSTGVESGGLDILSPTRAGSDSDWVTLSVASWVGCARKLDGTVWCWGTDDFGGGRPTNASAARAQPTVVVEP